MLLLGLEALAVPGLKAQYCWPDFQMACFYGDKITRVLFAGIDHPDDVCDDDADGKKDFTSSVAPGSITAGETYTLSVTVENSSSTGKEYLRAWIDYDRNGVFAPEESIDLGMGTGNTTLNAAITIPEDAATGNTRIRIMYRRTNPLGTGDACHSHGSYRGQVKDYALRIEPPSTLPVELLVYTARSSPEGVQLAWATASEAYNEFFTVEHSSDIKQWEALATVPGAGNSTSIRQYSYTDKAFREGIQYYRLKQTDLDGTAVYHPVQSIYVQRTGRPLLYPNPCTDHIRLHADESGGFAVIDPASGQVLPVASAPSGAAEWDLDTRSLPAGMYIIRLYRPGRYRDLRFIKQHASTQP